MLSLSVIVSAPALAWTPKRAPISTKWAAQVNPQNPLPEYPRPQLARKQWQSLNGIWEYQPGNEGDATPSGQKLSSEICVPYPVESALSGVMEHHDRLWYRRSFTVPSKWRKQQLMLHFGAVDYEAEVFVNGQSVGTHTGGYVPFSINITPYLKGTGQQELIVRVFDPTEKGGQPRGKQTTRPGGIMYTPTTGIWQTVWIEPVAVTGVQDVHMIPDVDNKSVRVKVNVSNVTPQTSIAVKIMDGNKTIKTVAVQPGVEAVVPIANPKLWSPDSPFLYDVNVAVKNGRKTTDTVSSYFGMRKISVGMSGGVPKLLLNNNFVFQMGPLDQGFWPEGIYTAPTDEALKYDIEMTKRFGFNMVRKHIKVEPARWYYWADKLGILVWQDMPSPNSYIGNPPPIDNAAFEQEVNDVIQTHWNSPAIVMWVIFNEGQARHDTAQLVNLARALDPSRLTNRDSGGGNEADDREGTIGDVDDVHSYPPPAAPTRSSRDQALVCGEYGGIGYIIPSHSLKPRDNWGYTSINTPRELEDLYGEFTGMLKNLRDQKGLSAAVYTQITDVEIESNGLMTYDRFIKCDPDAIKLANQFRYPSPSYLPIVATSEQTEQTWKYTLSAPPANWTQAAFDDSNWQSGPGVFGGATPDMPRIGTQWDSDDIWLRRTFNPSDLTPEQISQLVVRNIHDDDLEVWINGVLAYKGGGAVHAYENKGLSEEGKRAIVPNATNTLAVHCHESGGDQYVDVGLFQRVPAPGRK